MLTVNILGKSSTCKVNPLCGLMWVLVLLILSLIFDNPIYLFMLLALTVLSVFLANILKYWIKLLGYIFPLIPMIIIFNMIFSGEGETIICQALFNIPFLGFLRFKLTFESLFFGFIMALRLVVIASIFAVFSYSVNSDDLMRLILRFKFPYNLALITSLSTRFIPTMVMNIRNVVETFKVRGLDFSRGGFLTRIKNSFPVLVAVLSNSLERAVEVAEAMEVRGFGGKIRRTFYREIKVNLKNKISLILTTLLLVLSVVVRFFNFGEFHFYPTIQAEILSNLDVYIILILSVIGSVSTVLMFKGLEESDYL